MYRSRHQFTQIPFNRASTIGSELDYIKRSVDSGETAGDNAFSKKCANFFREHMGVANALLTPSCTHALEMAAILLNIQPGDEVIVPSFTFVSTALAFYIRGAKIVYCDIRRDTLNLDDTILEKYITPRTRAIIPVHYAGVGCEMDAIHKLASNSGIPVVEDNAHGLFGKYRGRSLGTFGTLATQSFHATKNFTCGEGGALLINDPHYVERAEIIREKGTDRSRFFRGQVDKYSWVDIGSSYLLSDILAAYLFAQLEKYSEIQSTRKRIWETYHSQLGDWAMVNGVRLPFIPEDCEQSYHMFYLLMPSFDERQNLIAHLRDLQIEAVFHYLPLHLSRIGVSHGGKSGDCPVSENVSDCLLRLPFYNALWDDDQSRIIEAITNYECT